MREFNLRLRDGHDLEGYRNFYKENGHVRVERLFPDEIANAIYDVLSTGTAWRVVHSDQDGKHVYYDPEIWNNKSNLEKQTIFQDVLTRARDGFAYHYAVYPMISAYLKKQDVEWPLHAMTEFLNSPEMLDFTRFITNEPTVLKHDAQATLYARGHFLNEHDDTGDIKERRAAYVMGFTKNWNVNWGGQLLFLNGTNTEFGLSPTFNTLTLFKVPRNHIVTQVTNFAGAGRFSITGWLRDDPK